MGPKIINGFALFGVGFTILGVFLQTPEGTKILPLNGYSNYLLLISAFLLFILGYLEMKSSSRRRSKKK